MAVTEQHFLAWIRRWRRRHPDDILARTYPTADAIRITEQLITERGWDWLRKK